MSENQITEKIAEIILSVVNASPAKGGKNYTVRITPIDK